MMGLGKRGLESIIATVLLILLSVIAIAVIAYFVFPLAKNSLNDGGCTEAINSINLDDSQYTCIASSPTETFTGFSIKANNPKIEGFLVALHHQGTALPFEIKQGKSYSNLRMIDGAFGGPLSVKNDGATRTYVALGSFERIDVAPILNTGKTCDNARSVVNLKNCLNPAVKNQIISGGSTGGNNASCGNNVTESPEECDWGINNGNNPNSCRSDCKMPRCGDLICDTLSESQLTCPGDCGSPPPSCQLTNAYWEVTNAIEGQQVTLYVDGTNCDNKVVSFVVKEDDFVNGEDVLDDDVNTQPNTAVFVNNVATTTWTAEWQSDWPFNPPEYYFKVTEVANTSDTINSPTNAELIVNPSSTSCGDGHIDAGETCDDGNQIGRDGCSATCNIEQGYDCTGEPSACTCPLGDEDFDGISGCWDNCPYDSNPGQQDTDNDGIGDACDAPFCGNAFIESPETCDPPQFPCTPTYGSTCQYCDNNCGFTTLTGPYCGDGVVNGVEACDGINIPNGASCINYAHNPPYTGGAVSCNGVCGINFGSCTTGTIGNPGNPGGDSGDVGA